MSGLIQCDTCGDVSNSDPDLPCGRDLSEEVEETGLGPMQITCTGTYRRHFIRLDLINGPDDTDSKVGTGDRLCECGNHQTACNFGRMHLWGTAYYQGKLVWTEDTMYCYVCGAVCVPLGVDVTL